MTPTILLVDDQRDILRLLHSTLNTMGHELEVIEAPSGEEALLEASRRHIDLLVSDYLLPGINGIELMHKVRIRHPDVKVILVTAMNSRKARDEMLNAGAVALFDKPIPLADFLDAVERALGLVRTIFPPENERPASNQNRLSDLLANFRQDVNAQAVFLLSDRGRVQARAGDLKDSSMEVSLLSALMAIYSAGLKVSKFIHQDRFNTFHIFNGGDHDLVLMPVDVSYALLLVGEGLANREHMAEIISSMQAVRDRVEKALKHIGATGPLPNTEEEATAPVQTVPKTGRAKTGAPPTTDELEGLLKQAGKKKLKTAEMDAFWSEAAEKHGNTPTDPDVISYEQARRLGLAPGEEK